MQAATSLKEQRVLVLAPFGRDCRVTAEVLSAAAIDSLCCEDMSSLCDELRQGAGALIVTVEALHPADMSKLIETLGEQSAWSDIPVVLATDKNRASAARVWALSELEAARHITLLERPLRVQTLISVVRSALAARKKQYELRDLVEELRVTVSRLDAEHQVRARFIDLLAHDLRGPLGISKFCAEILSRRSDNPEQVQQQAARIIKSIDRADKMMRNLLDAQRLRAGQALMLERQDCELVEIVREVTTDLSGADRDRVAITGEAELFGYWDPDLLWRALWNLVTNAVKYGSHNTPITISVGRERAEAFVAVHNHGPSIPVEEQKLLVQPFSRALQAQVGNQRGWGLGLTLAHGVAESHGGKLHISSATESGTTFTLHLPIGTASIPPAN